MKSTATTQPGGFGQALTGVSSRFPTETHKTFSAQMDRFLSVSQRQLCELMLKLSHRLHFASDEDCETLILDLTPFVQTLLLNKQRYSDEHQKYMAMNLDTLLSSGMPLAGSENVVVTRSATAAEKHKRRPLTSAPAVVRAVDSAKDDVALHLLPSLPLYWDFEANSYVVNVSRMEHSPMLVILTARPTSTSRHVPLIMYADLEKLRSLSQEQDSVYEHADHTEMSNRKRALRRLKKAIVAYSIGRPLSEPLQAALFTLPWASASFCARVCVFKEN